MATSESLTYKFRGEGLDDLRDEMQNLAEDFEDAGDEARQAGRRIDSAMEEGEDAAQELQSELNDINVRRALTSMQRLSGALDDIDRKLDRLDGRTIDVDTDVERARASGAVSGGGDSSGGRTRLPGELDEVGETLRFIRALNPATKAALGGVTALTAALAGAGGLAAAATAVAVELGPQGLQQRLKNVGARAKAAGRDFATEFRPVIVNEVIPAVDRMIDKLQAADDELASFSSGVLSFARETANAPERSTAGLALRGPLGVLAGQARESGFGATADVLDTLSPGGLTELLFEDAEGQGGSGGGGGSSGAGTGALSRAIQKIEKLRQARKKVIGQQDVLQSVGKKRKKVLQEQVAATKTARQKAAKFASTLDEGLAKRTTIKFVQRLTEKLRALKSEAQGLDFASRVRKIQKRVQGQIGQAPSGEIEAAGPQSFDMSAGGMQGMNDALSVTQLRLLQIERRIMRVSKRLRRGLGRTMLRTFKGATNIVGDFATGLMDAEQAGQALKRTMQRALSSIISQLVAATIKTLVLKAIAGAISGGAGASIPTGIVDPGITGTDILGKTATTSRLANVAAPSPALSGRTSAGVSAGAARLDGDAIRIPIRVIGTANDRHNQKQGQLGRR